MPEHNVTSLSSACGLVHKEESPCLLMKMPALNDIARRKWETTRVAHEQMDVRRVVGDPPLAADSACVKARNLSHDELERIGRDSATHHFESNLRHFESNLRCMQLIFAVSKKRGWLTE